MWRDPNGSGHLHVAPSIGAFPNVKQNEILTRPDAPGQFGRLDAWHFL